MSNFYLCDYCGKGGKRYDESTDVCPKFRWKEESVSYGENYGTATLARALRDIAVELYVRLDDGVPWSELREDAKHLMEGAIELWERMVDESD